MPLAGHTSFTSQTVSSRRVFTHSRVVFTVGETNLGHAMFDLRGMSRCGIGIIVNADGTQPTAGQNFRLKMGFVEYPELAPGGETLEGTSRGSYAVYEHVIGGDMWPIYEEFGCAGVFLGVDFTRLSDFSVTFDLNFWAASV